MIDTLTILYTSGMVLLVLIKAAQLDRQMPWFAQGGTAKKTARYNWRRNPGPADERPTENPTP